MTLYVVKHASDDFRLHKSDGTQMASWSQRPSKGELAVSVSNYYGNPTNGKGGAPDFIKDDTKISSGDFVFRDVSEHGSEEIPW